jgi:hydrogenase-1 operon protein HyaF
MNTAITDGGKTRARELITAFHGQLAAWRPTRKGCPLLDLTAESPATVKVINEVMGEGEVGIRLTGGESLHIQETIFAGVWRICGSSADGKLATDRIEGCPVPEAVVQAAQAGARAVLDIADLPGNVMNAPSLLHEIGAQMAAWRPGDRAYVLNLTLLPLTAEDHGLLNAVLGQGSVSIISRGFGNCRISSTSAANVWRVQYFNNMQALILDTIEIVDVPEVALAAPEDIKDSVDRLAELLEWMAEPVAA